MIWVAKNLYFLIVYLTGRTPKSYDFEAEALFYIFILLPQVQL